MSTSRRGFFGWLAGAVAAAPALPELASRQPKEMRNPWMTEFDAAYVRVDAYSILDSHTGTRVRISLPDASWRKLNSGGLSFP